MAKAGRPKKTFTPEQIKQIEDYALIQARNYTIAEALGIEIKLFERHFAKRCAQKRAEGKMAIYKAQDAQKNTPVMAIWLGKQHLEQKDVQKIDISSLPAIVLNLQDKPESGSIT